MRGDMPKKVVRGAKVGEVPAWSVSLRGDIHITVTRGGWSDTPEGCPENDGYGRLRRLLGELGLLLLVLSVAASRGQRVSA